MGHAHIRRAFRCQALERALPAQPRQGPDGALGRVRSADADRLRPRSRARPRRGRQGRRLDRPQGRHAHALRWHPARRDEHVDDDQRHGRLAVGPVCDRRGGERDRPCGAHRHDPERHRQGVPVARDLRVPTRALDAADRGHGRLLGQRDPPVEPDQRLQLPPAGGRGDPRAGDRLRALDRDRGARPGEGARTGRRGRLPQGVRPDLLLRQRRRSVRRGAREAPRDVADLGAARPRALRRHRPEAAAAALRRPGQLAGPDRGAAGEQHAAHHARGARRDPRPRAPAPARFSSPPGTRPSASRGPGTSSGASGSSRCWRSRRTSWSTPTSSRARR